MGSYSMEGKYKYLAAIVYHLLDADAISILTLPLILHIVEQICSIDMVCRLCQATLTNNDALVFGN